MKVFALDPSSQMGYAFRKDDGEIRCGTRDFSNHMYDHAVLGRRVHLWLSEMLDIVRPTHVAYEQPFIGQIKSSLFLVGLEWEINRVAELRKLERLNEAPVSIKKFITGNGNASKEDVIEAITKRNIKAYDDHQADAAALLLMMESKLGISQDLGLLQN